MPSTTPERAARWKDDGDAIKFLEGRGFKLNRQWNWEALASYKKLIDGSYDLSFMEEDAIIYLIEEWDFGGLENG